MLQVKIPHGFPTSECGCVSEDVGVLPRKVVYKKKDTRTWAGGIASCDSHKALFKLGCFYSGDKAWCSMKGNTFFFFSHNFIEQSLSQIPFVLNTNF